MSDTIVISIRDGISPFLQEWLKNNPRFIRSATKSAGWYVQKGIKESVPEISLGWKPRIPFWVRKRLVPSAPKTWLGRMKRAIGYQYLDGGSVAIGWTSSTAAAYGRIFEQGATRAVNAGTRRRWGRAGVPLKWSTMELHNPARPLYEPAMQIVSPGIVPHVEGKVKQYIENGSFTKKATRRKYKVYK